MGGGSGGIGHGYGGDNSNSGPKAKPKPVKDMVKARTNLGNSGMIYSAGETEGAPDTTAPSKVPYTDVVADYTKAAEKALDREKAPPAYRVRVKEYFNSLK